MEELMQEMSKIVTDVSKLWKSQLFKTHCQVPHLCEVKPGADSSSFPAGSPDGDVIQRTGSEEGF